MKVAIIGAGAIGSTLGGLLARKGHDITLIGRQPHVDNVNQHGLTINGILGELRVQAPAAETLTFHPDIAIIAVKTQDITGVMQQYKKELKDSIIITIQNGVQADHIAAEYLGKANIFSAVVLFGATFLEPGKVTYSPAGSLVLGHSFSRNDERLYDIATLVNDAVPTFITHNIVGAHWSKLVINENNALLAISGLSLQEAIRHKVVQRLSILMMREAVNAIRASGAEPASLPGLPRILLTKLIFLPLPIATLLPRLSARRMGQQPVLGSTLQSIKRGETTEIDYLNGEVVKLGKKHNIPTPVNEHIVKLVHKVAHTRTFVSIDDLTNTLHDIR